MTAHEFVIGETAAVWQRNYDAGTIAKVTVERDTKLYWIADGRRFRKSDGIEPGSNSNWDRGKYLLPLSDPKVIAASVAARKSATYSRLCAAQDELSRDRENPAAIEALRSALDKYAETIK